MSSSTELVYFINTVKKIINKQQFFSPHFVCPGFWLLHCHIEFHNSIGMGLVIQVGEPSEFPPKPKNFPECRSWHYTGPEEPVKEEDEKKVTCVVQQTTKANGASDLKSKNSKNWKVMFFVAASFVYFRFVW
jgi:hypothetical protein